MKKYLPFLISVLFFVGIITGQSASFFQKTMLIQQPTVTVTSAGTTTLAATSNQVHSFTGVAAQTLRLPDATTLITGASYEVINDSTGIVTVKDDDLNTIAVLKGSNGGYGTKAKLWLTSNASNEGTWKKKVDTEEQNLDHGNLLGLADDDHPQYLNSTRGDIRYYPKSNYIYQFAGFGYEPILTNATGQIDASLIPYGIGLGDVVGPSVATDNTIARFDGTTGKLLQGGNVVIDDSRNISNVAGISMDGAISNPTSLTMAGPISGVTSFTSSGNITNDTSTFVTFATSNRVGIGTATPDNTLDVEGGAAFLPGPSATPTLTTLANSQWTVSFDEPNDYFIFSGKKSAGATFTRALGSNAAGGSNTEVQFNNGGLFDGNPNVTLVDGTNTFTISSSGVLDSPGTGGATSFKAGLLADAQGTSGTAVGRSAMAGLGQENTAYGRACNAGKSADVSYIRNICIGNTATVETFNGAIGMGDNISHTGTRGATFGGGTSNAGAESYYFGRDGSISHDNVYGFGRMGTSTATGHWFFGTEETPLVRAYFGENLTTTPANVSIAGSVGSGADIAAKDLIIEGPSSTGNASPGNIVFKTTTAGASSSTVQTLSDRFKVATDSIQVVSIVAVPATPGAGWGAIYGTATDNKLWFKNSTGASYDLTATGSGTSAKFAAWCDQIVGSATDVTNGAADQSSIASAITAASAGDRVCLLDSYSSSENITFSKQLTIVGKGYGSVITGTVTFNSSSDGSRLDSVRVTDNITVDSGGTVVSIPQIWLLTGKTITDNDGTAWVGQAIQY